MALFNYMEISGLLCVMDIGSLVHQCIVRWSMCRPRCVVFWTHEHIPEWLLFPIKLFATTRMTDSDYCLGLMLHPLAIAHTAAFLGNRLVNL